MDPASVRQVETLCRQGWGFGGIREVVLLDPEPGSAALYRVTTDDRELLLTEHRRDRKDRDLQRTTAGASFLAGLDFPTPVYWATLGGHSVLTLEGRLYTLRTWVPGAPPVRAKLNLHTMSLLGRALGWCHTLLAELPISDTVEWPTRVEIALTEVEAAVKLIGARQDGGDSDREVLGVLLRKRNLLENAPDLPNRFKEYRTQIVHGDYHVENVIVSAHGGLAGVIDLGVVPGHPVWELYYALFWSLREWDTAAFDATMADAFLKGYLDEGRMTAEEIAVGPEMLYWWLLLETWDIKSYADNPADVDPPPWNSLVPSPGYVAGGQWPAVGRGPRSPGVGLASQRGEGPSIRPDGASRLLGIGGVGEPPNRSRLDRVGPRRWIQGSLDTSRWGHRDYSG